MRNLTRNYLQLGATKRGSAAVYCQDCVGVINHTQTILTIGVRTQLNHQAFLNEHFRGVRRRLAQAHIENPTTVSLEVVLGEGARTLCARLPRL